MTKPFHRNFIFVLLTLVIFAWLARVEHKQYVAKLAMQSDAMAIVNYYVPRRLTLQDAPLESNLVLPTFNSAEPKFAGLVLGNSADSLITLALDEGNGSSVLYIDKNNNEDLTDDGDPSWSEDKPEYWAKEELIDVYYNDPEQQAPVPYPVQFYRYKNRLQEALVAFRNGYREGHVTFEKETVKIALLDDNLDGLFNDLEQTALIVDLDQDGILNGHTDSPELFPIYAPFAIGSTSYVVRTISPSGDVLTFTLSDSSVTPRISLDPGLPAPRFRAQTLNDEIIDLSAFRNKVVLIDFWSTWCKPWEKELPYLRRTYQRYQPRGFEIIGISLDADLGSLAEYLKEHDVTWPQIATGSGWEMELVKAYSVYGIPKNFLLDRNGIIRYKDLQGPNLSTRISELLNESPADNL